jgi:hypothetical protein
MNKENKSVNQTPVEWLVNEYFGGIENCVPNFRHFYEQAKQMEENLVCESWDDGYEKGLRTREEKITDPVFNSKHYYDTKFKSE